MTKSLKKNRRKGKGIERLIGPMKQLKIKKEDQKVFSDLNFEDLPNEVICHVFSYLKIVDILKCGKVSKRFRAISNDQYLWPKTLNLCYKKVPVGFLQKLLDSGCKYLSLSGAVLDGTLNLTTTSGLKYLNLSDFELECYRKNSEEILKSCFSLQKLSLCKSKLSLNLISITSLQNGKTLKVLDLSKCTFLGSHSNKCEMDCIWQIVKTCTELKEISLFMTNLCEKSIHYLVSNLTSNIEKVDLFNMNRLRDKDVKKLVTRCNKITDLNLGGWNSTTSRSLNLIIENLKVTLERLSLTSFVRFNQDDLFNLDRLEKLEVLCFDGIMEFGNDDGWLKQHLPNVRIYANPRKRKIAIPREPGYNRQGFWDIKARQEDLFSNLKQKVFE